MEKSMLGHAGFLTALPKTTLEQHDRLVKGVEPETGYGAILKLSEAESHMPGVAHPPYETVARLRRGDAALMFGRKIATF